MDKVLNKQYLGNHILAEFWECDIEILNNVTLVQQHMEEGVKRANATFVKSVFHQFSPIGISGVVVIQESHFAIHTWPEHAYAAVDLFTCNLGMEYIKAYDYLVDKFKSKKHSYKLHKRGAF